MTVKKRLFISNTAIVLISLVMLMVVMLASLKVAEKTFLSRFDDFRQVTVTDRNGETIIIERGQSDDEEKAAVMKYSSEITVLFFLFISVGVTAIVFILLLSNIFTRITLKKIMQPADVLTAAAKRISTQNLDEPIDYKNHDEFKSVCDTFDDMQKHLKEGIEKNLSYERARTAMISDVSHDLRTPLTSMKGFLKGILDGVADSPEKQRMYADIAYKKACSMDTLLDKLFYFSKLETKNMPMYFEKTDLKSYLSRHCEAMRPELAGKDSVISFECGNEECFSDIDKSQFDRVLDNLIENSVKYNDGVCIKISLAADKSKNFIIVRDNGNGVPDGKIEHLFDRFYRADESRHAEKSGSGLGLYIVKSIIKLHGGEVCAENDGGLKITITLPKGEYENE